MLNSIIFLVKSFLGNFYRHLAIFSGHTAHNLHLKTSIQELNLIDRVRRVLTNSPTKFYDRRMMIKKALFVSFNVFIGNWSFEPI